MNYVIEYKDGSKPKKIEVYNRKTAEELVIEIIKERSKFTLVSFNVNRRREDRRSNGR